MQVGFIQFRQTHRKIYRVDMTAKSLTDSILNCEIATSLAFSLDRCMHAQRRQGVVYTLNLFQLFNQSPASKYPPHLPLVHPNSLSRRTVTKTRTDGHTSPLQIIMHLLIRLERFEDFLRKNDQFLTRMIDYNIFGGIANLLLPSRAAPAIYSSTILYVLKLNFVVGSSASLVKLRYQ